MADGISMPWLGRPADTQLAAETIGGVIGGALRATRKDVRQGRSYLETLPQGIEEGMGLARDPQYTLKKAQLQASILGIGAQYEARLQAAKIQQRQIIEESQDQKFLTESVANHAGNPEMILESLQSFVPKSARGAQGANQIRMAATQGMQRKLAGQLNSQFVQALGKLESPTLVSELMQNAYDENGVVRPEKLGSAVAEANKAKARTFAPIREEKLLGLYREAIKAGDTEASTFYRNAMALPEEKADAEMRRYANRRFMAIEAESAGLKAALTALERNPRSRIPMTEESKLLSKTQADVAASEAELEVLRGYRDQSPISTPVTETPTNAPAADPLGLFK